MLLLSAMCRLLLDRMMLARSTTATTTTSIHCRSSHGCMLEETLLVAEETMDIALQLGGMSALHEPQLSIVDHVPKSECIGLMNP